MADARRIRRTILTLLSIHLTFTAVALVRGSPLNEEEDEMPFSNGSEDFTSTLSPTTENPEDAKHTGSTSGEVTKKTTETDNRTPEVKSRTSSDETANSGSGTQPTTPSIETSSQSNGKTDGPRGDVSTLWLPTSRADPDLNTLCNKSFELTDVTSDSMKVTWSCSDCQSTKRIYATTAYTSIPCDGNTGCQHAVGEEVIKDRCGLDLEGFCSGREYEVKLIDKDGEILAAKSARLRPSKPHSPMLYDINDKDVESDSVALTWRNPDCPKKTKFVNSITYWKNSNEEDKETHPVVPAYLELTTVRGLTPWTEYTFMVRSCLEGDNDLCSSSEAKTARTKMGIPEAPTVEFESKTSEEIRISWNRPELNGELKEYRVDCGTGETTETTIEEKFTCRDLQPYTHHKLRVVADNTEKPGINWSHELKIRTEVGKAGKVKKLELLAEETKIVGNWEKPTEANANGPINYYHVRLFDEQGKQLIKEQKPDNTTVTFERLGIYVVYTFRINAVNLMEDGTPVEGVTEETKQRTKASNPGPCQDFKVDNVEAREVRVTWAEPKDKKGPIDGFILGYKMESQTTYGPPIRVEKTVRSYPIKDLEPFTDYDFRITAYNEVDSEAKEGTETKSSTRTNPDRPTEPRDVTVRPKSSDVIEVGWNEPAKKYGPLDGYVVHYKAGVGQEKTSEVASDKRMVAIDGLVPYRDYQFWVTAFNNHNGRLTSVKSETKDAKTFTAAPDKVSNLVVWKTTSTTVALKWQKPATPNGPIDGFYLQVDDKDKEEIELTVSEYLVPDLKPYTEHTFKVWAYNQDSSGVADKLEGAADSLEQRTYTDKPSECSDFKLEVLSSSSISVKWEAPERRNGPIAGYLLRFNSTTEDLGENVTTDTSLTIVGLQPYTEYFVEVTAYNEPEDGSTDNLEGNYTGSTGMTDPDRPSKPLAVKEDSKTDKTFQLSWMRPDQPRGPLNGYKITYKIANPLHDGEGNPKTYSTPEEKFLARDLTPWRKYEIEVVAFNHNDRTNQELLSEIAKGEAQTDVGVPMKPDNVQAHPKSAKMIEVTWRPVEPITGETSYWIQIEEAKSDLEGECKPDKLTWDVEFKQEEVRGWEERSKRVSDLTSNNCYRVKVVSSTEAGNATSEHSGIAQTWAGIPDAAKHNLTKRDETKTTVSIFIPEEIYSSSRGKITRYALIVGPPKDIGERPASGETNEDDDFGSWSEQDLRVYRATPENWNPYEESLSGKFSCTKASQSSLSGRMCTLGMETDCKNGSFCNGPLREATQYRIKFRGYTTGGWADTFPLSLQTTTNAESSNTVMIVGAVVAVVLVVALVGFLLILQKKYDFMSKLRSAKKPNQNGAPMQALPLTQTEALNNRPNLPNRSNGTSGYSLAMRSNPQPNSSRPPPPERIVSPNGDVKMEDFFRHFDYMNANSGLIFDEEFEKLKLESPKHSTNEGELTDNKVKNRWVNILPYDHSRVKLNSLQDGDHSDYINANYIEGSREKREFIATQGPLPNTVEDFWRMIWDENVTMIVMVTQCVERGKVKCEQYWPDDMERTTYGDLRVRKIEDRDCLDYTLRVFKIKRNEFEIQVKQMHFNRWPDFGCPETPELLINFVGTVRDHLTVGDKGPIAVHCSAGVGRTGTFIAVDRLLHQIRDANAATVNVYKTVLDMRQNRTLMVQTADQYIYIHKCVRKIIEERGKGWNPGDDQIYENCPRQSQALY